MNIEPYRIEDFDPDAYDVFHLGVSGGKDSTAALLWLVYESGWDLSKLVVSFCDTNNEDLLTYAYLEILNSHVFPIDVIHPPLDFWQLAYKKRRFPGAKRRFCTQHLKLIPSARYINELEDSRGKVLLLSGTRRAEGKAHNNRGNLEVWHWNEFLTADQYLPVYEMSIEQVWGLHQAHLQLDWVVSIVANDPYMRTDHKEQLISRLEAHGIPRNPLYDMQAQRVGCFPCVNSRKSEIRAMATFRPERITFIDEKEKWMGERSRFGFSSFFPAKTVPVEHRTVHVIRDDGVEWQVCDIHDVVRWSKTKWGGKQFSFDFEAFYDEMPLACDYRGLCE